ncbi:MAG: DUF192 domain-containing protein [Actinomycetota bacterium]
MRLRAGQQGELIEVMEARGVLGRMLGLLGREGLPPGRGLLLRGRQVHTIGMTFAIDAIYLSKVGEVLAVRTLSPGAVGPFLLGARYVLELGAGEAERIGIGPGMRLESGG